MARLTDEPNARELQVWEAYCRHGSRKLAAAELGITDQTAAVHLRNLYRMRPELRRRRIPQNSGPDTTSLVAQSS